MPIYEYLCDDCGNLCEIIQKVTDGPVSVCPECGGRMHKQISHTSFILKGSGWYVTDYASPERKKAMQSDGTEPAAQQEKPEAKAGSATTTKAEAHSGSASKS